MFIVIYLKWVSNYWLQCHPDVNPDNEQIHKKFLLINEAYSVLSRSEEREEYDIKTHLQSMEVQNTPPNPWSVNYPAPPSVDSDELIKETYKNQTYKFQSYAI